MSELDTAHLCATGRIVDTRTRWWALVAGLSLIIAACGGGSSTEPDSAPGAANPTENGADETETPSDDVDAGETSDPAEPSGSSGDANSVGSTDDAAPSDGFSVEMATVGLPAEIELFEQSNQTASLNENAYLVSGRPDGMRLIAVNRDAATDTDALIAGGSSAKVFNSGSRIVMTGTDAAGNLKVLSSKDGTTFEETTIPAPQRYVDADVWKATTLFGDVMGIADFNGELFAITSQGIRWPRPADVAAQFGYTISDEVGDAATTANTVRQAPQGDGDFLFTFVKGDEVVLEVLGSEAGIEPGYREAAQEASASETRIIAGWMIIAGKTASQIAEPPLGGGLQEDLRLNALFSDEDGVVAIMTDFSPDGPIGLRAQSSEESMPVMTVARLDDQLQIRAATGLPLPPDGGAAVFIPIDRPVEGTVPLVALKNADGVTLYHLNGDVVSQDKSDVETIVQFATRIVYVLKAEAGADPKISSAGVAKDGSVGTFTEFPTTIVKHEIELDLGPYKGFFNTFIFILAFQNSNQRAYAYNFYEKGADSAVPK